MPGILRICAMHSGSTAKLSSCRVLPLIEIRVKSVLLELLYSILG